MVSSYATSALPVVGGAGVGEVLRGSDPALEVGVLGVDAGVEDCDLGALAVVSGGPDEVGADLLGRLVAGGLNLAVEPELLQAGGRAGTGVGDVRPEGGGL